MHLGQLSVAWSRRQSYIIITNHNTPPQSQLFNNLKVRGPYVSVTWKSISLSRQSYCRFLQGCPLKEVIQGFRLGKDQRLGDFCCFDLPIVITFHWPVLTIVLAPLQWVLESVSLQGKETHPHWAINSAPGKWFWSCHCSSVRTTLPGFLHFQVTR